MRVFRSGRTPPAGGLGVGLLTTLGQTRPDPKTATNSSSQWSCREQLESGLLHWARVRDRRFVAIDPQRGLVYGTVKQTHGTAYGRTDQRIERALMQR